MSCIFGPERDSHGEQSICAKAAILGAVADPESLTRVTKAAIGVGTVGAEGAAVPPIFSQWVQVMHYASPIFGVKKSFNLLCINKKSVL